MLVIGITGQTGAGKTLVSELLLEKGYKIINADKVSRLVVEKGRQCLMDIVIEFGLTVLNADGSLNRKALGNIIFSDSEKKEKLQSIIFPYILEEIEEQMKAFRDLGEKAVFLDAPTLIESGYNKFCDRVVSVVAPSEDRFIRIIRRDDITELEAQARMDAQHDDEYYIKNSDFVINNNGEVSEVRIRVLEMLDKLGI